MYKETKTQKQNHGIIDTNEHYRNVSIDVSLDTANAQLQKPRKSQAKKTHKNPNGIKKLSRSSTKQNNTRTLMK